MIESLGGFLQHNLIVLLAVVLVPMKFGILRLCGDKDAQKVALVSIPEDLVYVSLGLILGDFATAGGAFHKYFKSSQHLTMNLFVTVLIGMFVAIAIHVLAKWTNDNINNWRAAAHVRIRAGISDPAQQDLPLAPGDENIRMIQTRHITLAAILYLFQLGLAIRWLAWIASVLADG
ncbi:MAG TPA: hypothetical protein VFC39_21140 [Acidobacteriaceae bacterium]|nr:hypothetical protein [Acidobacteriaceae bacterium]